MHKASWGNFSITKIITESSCFYWEPNATLIHNNRNKIMKCCGYPVDLFTQWRHADEGLEQNYAEIFFRFAWIPSTAQIKCLKTSVFQYLFTFTTASKSITDSRREVRVILGKVFLQWNAASHMQFKCRVIKILTEGFYINFPWELECEIEQRTLGRNVNTAIVQTRCH